MGIDRGPVDNGFPGSTPYRVGGGAAAVLSTVDWWGYASGRWRESKTEDWMESETRSRFGTRR